METLVPAIRVADGCGTASAAIESIACQADAER